MKEFVKFIFVFFLGWKRNVGMLTLAMACAMAAAWLRSELYSSIFVLPFNSHDAIIIVSSNGCVWIEKELVDTLTMPLWSTVDASEIRKARLGKEAHWPSHWFFNKVYRKLLPYWCLILPLTALSAFLLLSKPSKSTQMKITEPVANDGT